MDFFGNNDRKGRCDDLIGMMDTSMNNMTNSQQVFDGKADFYKEIVTNAVQANGYRNIDELKADMMGLMDQIDKDDINDMENIESSMTVLESVMQGMGFVCFAAQGVGAIRKKRKYGTNFLPLIPWNKKANAKHAAKVLKNATIYRLNVAEPRAAKVALDRKKISQFTFDQRMKSIRAASNNVGLHVDANYLPGGKFANNTSVLKAAEMLKKTSKIAAWLDVLGWIGEIGSIIVEITSGAILKERLKESIDALCAQRFTIKKLEMMGRKYDIFNEAVAIAVGQWVDQQAAALGQAPPGGGGGAAPEGDEDNCYLKADSALELSLAQAERQLELGMAGVCDCAVLDELEGDDANSWTDEDPSYKEMMLYLEVENPPDSPRPTCPIHGSGGNNTNEEEIDPEDDLILPTPLYGATDVTAANCRYLELMEGNGALWRTRGGFWTFQQPHSSTGETRPGLQGIRIQFQEKKRTSNKIYLQNIGNWKFDKEAGNWDPPDNAADLYPVVVINFEAGMQRLETLPGNTNLSGSTLPSGAAWGARQLDPASYSNLAKINGWTIYFAPTVYDASNPYPLVNTHECSPATGWKFVGTGWADSNLIEHERTKTRVSYKPRGRGGSYPMGRILVDKQRIEWEGESDGISSWPISTDNSTANPLWKARLNFA